MKNTYKIFKKNGSILFMALLLCSFSFLMPAFEGYDENAHYGRVIDAMQRPESQFASDVKINQLVLNYPGPMAYSSGVPPFGNKNTYDVIYANNTEIFLSEIKKYPAHDRSNELSDKKNWQYQHPPLYYLSVGIIANLFEFESLVNAVIVFRIISIIMVIAGLLLARSGLSLLSTNLGFSEHLIQNAFWIFALCFPMFYFEFARVGNDSLTFLLMATAFLFMVKSYYEAASQRSLFLMSTSLMLCLWTKALVIPIIPLAAIFSWYVLNRNCKLKISCDRVVKFLICFIFPVALGFSWYIYLFFKFNHLGIGFEAEALKRAGGLMIGLEKNFDLHGLIRGALVPFGSFIYAGSWSLIRAPIFIYVILGAVYLNIAYDYFNKIRTVDHKIIAIQPVALFCLMYIGMLHHVFVSMALDGLGTTPGWYLYVLTPWIIMAVVVAVRGVGNKKILLYQAVGLLTLFFTFMTSLLIYTGVIIKSESKGMVINETLLGESVGGVIQRLEYVAYPRAAVVLFVMAILCAIMQIFIKENDENNNFNALS